MGKEDELKLIIQRRATFSPKAEIIDGKCSACGCASEKKGNFCPYCGATFLTEEQIEKHEFNI